MSEPKLSNVGYNLNSVQGLPDDVVGHQQVLRKKAAALREKYFTEPENDADHPFYKGERIAPFTELQKKVHTHAGKLLARKNKHVTPEIEKRFQKSGNTHLGKKVEELLAGSYANPLQSPTYASYLKNPELTQLIKDMRDQSQEHFTRDILPQISNSFIASGAYNSSARQLAEKKAAERQGKSFDRQINQMLYDLHKGGTEAAERQMERQQQAGNLVGSAYGAEQQNARENLNTAQNVEKGQVANELATLGAAGTVGESQQNQAQRRNAAAMEEYYEPANKQEEMLAKEAALTAGQPMPIFQRQTMGEMPPVQPNPYQQIASAVQGLSGLPAKASGGRIKKRASGGVAPQQGIATPGQYTDEQLHAMHTPQMQHLMAEQQRLSQPDPDAQRMYLAKIAGGIAGADPRNPHAGYVQGIKDAIEEHKTNKKSRSERSQAIADAIQNSRVDQIKMMHMYEKNRRDHMIDMMKEQREERKDKRSAEEHKLKMADTYGVGLEGDMAANFTQRRKKLSPEERKVLDEAREGYHQIKKIKEYYKTLEETSDPKSKKYVGSGGILENIVPKGETPFMREWLGWRGNREDIEAQDQAMKALPMATAQYVKGARNAGIGVIKAAQESKVSPTHEPEFINSFSKNGLRATDLDEARQEIILKAYQRYHTSPLDSEGWIDEYDALHDQYPGLTVDQFLKIKKDGASLEEVVAHAPQHAENNAQHNALNSLDEMSLDHLKALKSEAMKGR